MFAIRGIELEEVIPELAKRMNKLGVITLYDVFIECGVSPDFKKIKWMEKYFHFFLKHPKGKYNHIWKHYYTPIINELSEKHITELVKKTLMFTNTGGKKCIGMIIFEEKTLKVFFRSSFLMPTMYYDLIVLDRFIKYIYPWRKVNKVVLYFNKIKINTIYGLPFTQLLMRIEKLSPYMRNLRRRYLKKVDQYAQSNNFQRSRVYRRFREEFGK